MNPNADDIPGQPAELPLDAWHCAMGARMVPFAGHLMPLQYAGIVAEHEWTRGYASLFDVSHMGQLLVHGSEAEAALFAMLPADVAGLRPGRVRYSLLLHDNGGIRDDLMVTRMAQDRFYLVVNGATKMADIGWLQERLPEGVELSHLANRALFALQGPMAAAVLEAILPGPAADLSFMQASTANWHGYEFWIGRSGYTGEDGFELSLPAEAATTFADALVAHELVRPAGLGARDSLRLEAGLPLYGHDIDLSTDPISAGLGFAISKKRRTEGGFPGDAAIARVLGEGPGRHRVGMTVEGRQPAREGATVLAGEDAVGRVTSGGFSPTLGQPIAMAYVDAPHIAPGTRLAIDVRGKRLDATVTPMPFVPHNYHRAGASA